MNDLKIKAGKTTKQDINYLLMFLLRQADSAGKLSKSQIDLAREAKINVEVTSVIQELGFYAPSSGRGFKTLTFKKVTDDMVDLIYERHLEKNSRPAKISTNLTNNEDTERLIRIEEMLSKLVAQFT